MSFPVLPLKEGGEREGRGVKARRLVASGNSVRSGFLIGWSPVVSSVFCLFGHGIDGL